MIWLILGIFLIWWILGFAGFAFWWIGEFGELDGFPCTAMIGGLLIGPLSWAFGILIHEPWKWYRPWRYGSFTYHHKPFWIKWNKDFDRSYRHF
jgi:hypothetical protein